MPGLFRFDCRSVLKPRDPAELSKRYQLPDRWRPSRSCSFDPVGRWSDGRFSNYLASSFKNEHRRRTRPGVERNKLIVITIFVGLILFAVVYQIAVG